MHYFNYFIPKKYNCHIQYLISKIFDKVVYNITSIMLLSLKCAIGLSSFLDSKIIMTFYVAKV